MHVITPNVGLAGVVTAALTLLVLSAPGHAAAACDPGAPEVTEARDVVAGACDCASAASPRAWRSCVRSAIAPLVGSTLSASCARLVERIETRSTCGRDDRVVCCSTDARGRTRASLRRSGQCRTPAGGSSCESPRPYLEDACVPGGCAQAPACGNSIVDLGEDCDPPNGLTCSTTCEACTTELGCVAPTSCGDGTVQVGETCDPPNGTTCSSTCTSCAAAAPGELLIGCTSGQTRANASALPATLLVAYSDTTPGGGTHAVARRLANDGTPDDVTPLLVSGPVLANGLLGPLSVLGGSSGAVAADANGFYVSWDTSTAYGGTFPATVWAARRVPATGPISSAADPIVTSVVFGQCHTLVGAPLHFAPRLDDGGFHATWRVVYQCGGGSAWAETIAGVGDFFSFPPPGNLSSGPAPIVRGGSDVAAVWWNTFVSSVAPPTFDPPTLAASFIEPGAPVMISLTPGSSPAAPALAAVGDTFVALFANGNELRAVRFTRAAGALDPAGGILVATAANPIGQIVAAGDGTHVIVAWLESDGSIRTIRVAPDGTLPSPTPTTVATGATTLDIAANATTALVAFIRDEGSSRSVRAVLLPGS